MGTAPSRRGRLLLAAGVLGTAAAVAGLGTWATFTDTAPVAQGAISAGTVDIAIPGPGATNRLTLGASGIVPGDTMQRAVDLTNAGSEDLAAITLTTSASPSSVLDTDATNGLQLAIDRCSVPWTESGTSPAFTYTCAGTTQTVLASRPVIGSDMALANLSALSAGGTDHLRVTLSFPSSAGNAFQGVTTAVTYTFTATQRAATSK
jgi:hypothetical protein